MSAEEIRAAEEEFRRRTAEGHDAAATAVAHVGRIDPRLCRIVRFLLVARIVNDRAPFVTGDDMCAILDRIHYDGDRRKFGGVFRGEHLFTRGAYVPSKRRNGAPLPTWYLNRERAAALGYLVNDRLYLPGESA